MSSLRFSHGHIFNIGVHTQNGFKFRITVPNASLLSKNDVQWDKNGFLLFLIINKLQIVTVHREINGGYLRWGAEMIHFVSVWNDV